jgi:hypothetical protein
MMAADKTGEIIVESAVSRTGVITYIMQESGLWCSPKAASCRRQELIFFCVPIYNFISTSLLPLTWIEQ